MVSFADFGSILEVFASILGILVISCGFPWFLGNFGSFLVVVLGLVLFLEVLVCFVVFPWAWSCQIFAQL